MPVSLQENTNPIYRPIYSEALFPHFFQRVFALLSKTGKLPAHKAGPGDKQLNHSHLHAPP